MIFSKQSLAFCVLQVYMSFLMVGHTHEDVDQV